MAFLLASLTSTPLSWASEGGDRGRTSSFEYVGRSLLEQDLAQGEDDILPPAAARRAASLVVMPASLTEMEARSARSEGDASELQDDLTAGGVTILSSVPTLRSLSPVAPAARAASPRPVPVRSSSLAARMSQLRQEHPDILRTQEEAPAVAPEPDVALPFAAPAQEAEERKPAARPAGRQLREEAVPVDLPELVGPVAPFAAAAPARNEAPAPARVAERRGAVPPPVRPRPIPARPPADPITVGLYPVGPKVTGKSVLVNLATVLSVYLNEEVLGALDRYYDAQYPEYIPGSGNRNPFRNETEAPGTPLPEELREALSRFVSAEGLEEALKSDAMLRCLSELPLRACDLIEEYAEKDVSKAPTVLLLPAAQLARYFFVNQQGIMGNSDARELYADQMQAYPKWRLVIGNRAGWRKINRNEEVAAERELTLLEQVQMRVSPDLTRLDASEEENINNMKVKMYCGKHLLFQMPAKWLQPGVENNPYLQQKRDETIAAIQYVQRENMELPILLAVSYASQDYIPHASQVSTRMFDLGVYIPSYSIFFFELGGMLDVDLQIDPHTVSQFSQWLTPWAAQADMMERYRNASGGERIEVINEITPRLPRLADGLQLRWAKNLAMVHKLLKYAHAIGNPAAGAALFGDGVFPGRLQRELFLKRMHQRAAHVCVDLATRQVVASNAGLEGEATPTQIHFIRLFEDGRNAEAFSYDADLRHISTLEEDEIFVPERDIDARIRNSYLWRPNNPPRESTPNGMIVRTHGTLKTIVHPGAWLFFDLGREEYTEVKQTKIRNFRDDAVSTHNTLQTQREEIETARVPQEAPGQLGWLILNADLATQEIEDKRVHAEQQEDLRTQRRDNVNLMIRYLIGVSCTDEELAAGAFVAPLRGEQVLARQEGTRWSRWIYRADVDAASFSEYATRVQREQRERDDLAPNNL